MISRYAIYDDRFNVSASKRKLRNEIILTVIALAIIIPTTAVFLSTNDMFATIPLTPQNFQPVRVSSRTIDVGSSVNSHDLATGVASYNDGNHIYPGVSIFQSDPYLSDDQGVPIDVSKINDSQLLATDGKLVIGDQVFFLHEYYFTEQIGVRTLFNFVDPGDTTSFVSPYAGQSYYKDYNTGRYYETYTYGTTQSSNGASYYTGAKGALCLYTEFSQKGCPNSAYYSEVATPMASIQSCLTHVYFPNVEANPGSNGQGWVSDTYYTPTGATSYVQTHFGNSPVWVYPHINVQGMTNYIKYGNYQYNVTLPNGTRTLLTVNTDSAVVGFTDARQTGTDLPNMQGDVPLVTPTEVNTKTHFDTSQATPSGQSKTVDSNTDPQGIMHTVLTGYIHPSTTSNDAAVGGYKDIIGYTTSLDNQNINIDLSKESNFYNMAQNLVLTPAFKLQPWTTVTQAHGTIQWASDRRDTDIWGGTIGNDYSWQGSQSVQWPCGVTITNVYAICQFTFRVAVITHNQIDMVTGTGQKLNASAILKDYGSSGIIRDPSMDLTDVSLETPPSWTWASLLQGFLNQFGIFGYIALAVGVIVLIVVLYFVLKTFLGKLFHSGSKGGKGEDASKVLEEARKLVESAKKQ